MVNIKIECQKCESVLSLECRGLLLVYVDENGALRFTSHEMNLSECMGNLFITLAKLLREKEVI